nr:hypothetical protein [Micrococcus luteus]
MTTPSDPPAPLTPAQQDAAFRPSHTPATPWPALAQALAEAGIAAHVHGAAPADGVTGVSLDSRVVRPGDLYVAVPGRTPTVPRSRPRRWRPAPSAS